MSPRITDSTFKDFLFVEYENIAKAHFESQKQLALFFRYYTLFFSVPIVIASVWKGEASGVMDLEMFGYLLIVVSVIGFSFYWITIDLKHEAVLYARTVNGIRYYFYQDIDRTTKNKIKTLPTNKNKPSYFSPWNPILLIMMFVNCVYLMLGFSYIEWFNFFSVCIVVSALLAHILLNYYRSVKQELRYRKMEDR